MLHNSHPDRSAGFSLMISIFIMVTISAFIALLANIFSGQVQENTLFLLNRQAYYAAMSGLEWLGYEINQAEPTNTYCPASTTFTMPSGTTLSPFTVTVLCTLSTSSESVHAYVVTSTAVTGTYGTTSYIQQSVNNTLYYAS